jgi:outer membrane protein assembly factor BamB
MWKGLAGTFLNSSPAVGYGHVFIGSGDGTLKVFAADGCGQPLCRPTWVGTAPGDPGSAMEASPMLANGVVYGAINNGRVYAWPAAGCGRARCAKVWSFVTQDPLVNSSPVMVNGALYVSGSNFGFSPELYVFHLAGTH